MVLPPSQWRNEVPLEVPNANQHHFAQGVRVEGKSGGLEIVEPAAKLLSTTLSDDDRTLRERSGKNILDKIIDRVSLPHFQELSVFLTVKNYPQ